MTRTGFDPQLAALAARYRCVAWDMPGYGASPLPAGGLSFPLLADAAARLIETLGETRAHLVGPLAGRPDRAAHGAPPPRARALARAARLEPGVRARRHRSRGLEAAAPRSARRRRDAGEHRRAGAALDHGARTPTRARSRPPSRRCRASRPTGCAPRSSACPRTTCATGSARSPCRRSCSSASSTTETPLSYAEALAAGIPGARLQIIPGAGHISNLEAPEAVNIALREHLDARRGATA